MRPGGGNEREAPGPLEDSGEWWGRRWPGWPIPAGPDGMPAEGGIGR